MDALDLRPSETIVLACDEGSWRGTFLSLLDTVCADFLSDGPIPIRLRLDDGSTVEGTLHDHFPEAHRINVVDVGHRADPDTALDDVSVDLEGVCAVEIG